MGVLTPMNSSVCRGKEYVIKFLSFFFTFFFIVAILGATFFVHAERPIKAKDDGPYWTSALSERHGLAVSGKVRAEGNKRAVNYSWHMAFCRLDPWVALGSMSTPTNAELNGSFTERLDQPAINVNILGKLYGTASAWGSDTVGKWFQASVSDTSN